MMNDRYVVEAIVGEGTFGQTMKAFDMDTKDTVAIKYIKDVTKMNQDDMRTEIDILVLLNSLKKRGRETIVTLKDMFKMDDHPYYVFEYLPCTLEGVFKTKKLTGSDLRYIGYSLTQSVAFLSSNGIVHADLKPDNIMFNALGELKIVDFGFSFYENKPNCDLCQTRSYRAPEVCLYLKFGCVIDMWSVGCILAQCYSKRPLLKSKNELHHFQIMAEIFGMLPDDMIESCPVKSGYFTKMNGRWQIKDSGHKFSGPSSKSLSSVLKIKKNTTNELLFIDMLEKMLTVRPESRMRPLDALEHPFFDEFSDGRQGNIDLISYGF